MTVLANTDNGAVRFPINFVRRANGRKELRRGPEPGSREAAAGHTPRIARLMALALEFDEMIRSGGSLDYAELARQGCVTRARMSQVMGLLNLAPDIQEALLFLPPVVGRDPVTERDLRPVVGVLDWDQQRMLWQRFQSMQEATGPKSR